MCPPPDSEWMVSHFSQSNPAGPGQGAVPALLRRVADSIESLGDVDIQDMTFASEVTGGEDVVTMTVYYNADEPRRRFEQPGFDWYAVRCVFEQPPELGTRSESR